MSVFPKVCSASPEDPVIVSQGLLPDMFLINFKLFRLEENNITMDESNAAIKKVHLKNLI